jgi:hypothetical protein
VSGILRISGLHHDALHRHLFPGDGLEAVAFALCGRRRADSNQILTVQRIVPVPYDLCQRSVNHVTWQTEFLADLLDEIQAKRLALVKIHSHPSSCRKFSSLDDQSDAETFRSVFAWTEVVEAHATAVMLPDRTMFGRLVLDGTLEPLSAVVVAGDNISYWHAQNRGSEDLGAFEAQGQLFGNGTTSLLRKLRIGVVGCSGTGSVVIELLARLGIGELVLVDDELIEGRNLNRIPNSKHADIGRPKVEVLAEAVKRMGLGTMVLPLKLNLYNSTAVLRIAECDAVFGCVDTSEGRHLLNRIATFYVVPYFDLGVHLAADGCGGIDEASGVVHYLQPGLSSLLGRRGYTLEQVRAEGIRRTNPTAYSEQRKLNYIEGVNEHAPAVVSVNASIASLAVNEFLARIHPFRSCANRDCATIRFSFMESLVIREPESRNPCKLLIRHVGKGDVEPLLEWPTLSN